MNWYNGFSPQQRTRADRWLNEQWTARLLERPRLCCACGQDKGIIDAHAEDYSEPFAAGKTDEFHLCYTCHLMLHCRFRSPEQWARYRATIAQGGHFAPMFTRNFGTFASLFLDGPTMYARALEKFTPGPSPARLVLDEIDASPRGKETHGAGPKHLSKTR